MAKSRHPRLDQLLVMRGIFDTRSKARGAILAGEVYVGGQRVDKAGVRIAPDATIEIRGRELPYVGRGGLKLEGALEAWSIDVSDRICVDVGASTGGFTDCLLQRGARLVFAIDVGYGQLAWKLRQDPRVIVLERLNARYLKPDHLEFEGNILQPEFASADVSFISLRLILPPLFAAVQPGAPCVTLVKPQFEAGPENVGKGGIVRNPQVHRDVLQRFARFLADEGAELMDIIHSPITGGDGNIEFLAHFLAPGPGPKGTRDHDDLIERTVTRAHQELVQNDHRGERS